MKHHVFLVLDVPGDVQLLFAVTLSVITISTYLHQNNFSLVLCMRNEKSNLGTRPVAYML